MQTCIWNTTPSITNLSTLMLSETSRILWKTDYQNDLWKGSSSFWISVSSPEYLAVSFVWMIFEICESGSCLILIIAFYVDNATDRSHTNPVLNFSIYFMLLGVEKIRSTSDARGTEMTKGQGRRACCEVANSAPDQQWFNFWVYTAGNWIVTLSKCVCGSPTPLKHMMYGRLDM